MKQTSEHPIYLIGLGCADLARPESWRPHLGLLAGCDVICGGQRQLRTLLAAAPDISANAVHTPENAGSEYQEQTAGTSADATPCSPHTSQAALRPEGAPPAQTLTNESEEAVTRPKCLPFGESATNRHLLLPIGAGFAEFAAKLRALRSEGKKIAVLASGDPLFYGAASSLISYFAPEELCVYPAISSVQEAFARLSLPWHEARFVSLHGRNGNLSALYNAVQSSQPPRPVCVLLDRQNSPARLAAQLLERGISEYRMHFFANLRGGTMRIQNMAVTTNFCCMKSSANQRDNVNGKLAEAAADHCTAPPTSPHTQPPATGRFGMNNQPRPSIQAVPEIQTAPEVYVSALIADAQAEMPEPAPEPGLLILEPLPPEKISTTGKNTPRPNLGFDPRLGLGMPDEFFTHSAGLITKQPVRAVILATLRLTPEQVLFDIGAGCGSVGLEASAMLHAGQVFAIEQHAERVEQIIANRKKFRAANLEVLHGNALALLDGLPTPDRIFIGGGLGAAALPMPEAKQAGAANQTIPGDKAQCAMSTHTTGTHPNALLRAAWNKLRPGGRLALSCVLLGSLETARAFFEHAGITPELVSVQASSASPLAGDLQLKAMNQVFVMSAWKPESE